MKLQKKSIMITMPLFFLICLIGILGLILFLKPVFHNWADNNAEKNTNLAIDILEYEQLSLSTIAKDYAIWTEMYEFVESEAEGFTESNIGLESLGYDIGFIVNSDGELIYCEVKNELGELENRIKNKENINKYFDIFMKDEVHGFIKLSNKYYNFATHPITDTNMELPPNGYIFFGKYFNETNHIPLWNKFFDLEITMLHNSSHQRGYKDLNNHNRAVNNYKGINYLVTKIDDSKRIGKIDLVDIEGRKFAEVNIIMKTDFIVRGRNAILSYYFVMILCLAAYIAILMIFLIKSDVLEPIDKIIKKIAESDIYYDSFIKERLSTREDNEIVQLEHVIDSYIESINIHRDKIMEINSSLEEKVKERTKELSDLNEKLETQAYYDSLTGIPNRAFFYDQINRVFNRVKRSSKDAALLYMDLDGFKAVNDTYGHEAGDLVLIEFVNRIKSRIRITDFFARMGGDEFALLIENLESKEDINSVIDVVNKITCEDIVVGERVIKIGVSIGYAVIDNTQDNIYDVIKVADKEMYKKKKENKCN